VFTFIKLRGGLMAYGILKTSTNTGIDSELGTVFAAPLSVISNQPVFISDTASLKQIVTSQNVQRWEIEANTVPTNDSSLFLTHSVVNGYNNPVYVRMPQVYRFGATLLNVGYIFLTTGTIPALSSTLNIVGGGVNGIVSGDFINFSNHTKVYLITAVSYTNSTNTQITVFPPVSVAVTSTNIKFGMLTTMYARYDPSTTLGIKYVDGILSDPGSVKLIEAI